MDDLDALLTDLQGSAGPSNPYATVGAPRQDAGDTANPYSTVNKPSQVKRTPPPVSPKPAMNSSGPQTPMYQYIPQSGDRRSGGAHAGYGDVRGRHDTPPPPIPPHPAEYGGGDQPLYEAVSLQLPPLTPGGGDRPLAQQLSPSSDGSAGHYSSVANQGHYSSVAQGQQHSPGVQGGRYSAGVSPQPKSTALASNVRELDALLADLDSPNTQAQIAARGDVSYNGGQSPAGYSAVPFGDYATIDETRHQMPTSTPMRGGGPPKPALPAQALPHHAPFPDPALVQQYQAVHRPPPDQTSQSASHKAYHSPGARYVAEPSSIRLTPERSDPGFPGASSRGFNTVPPGPAEPGLPSQYLSGDRGSENVEMSGAPKGGNVQRSATRELDDLMASLELLSPGPQSPNRPEPFPVSPIKSATPPPQQQQLPAEPAAQATQEEPAKRLDTMMNDLQTTMGAQGTEAIEKGVCEYCGRDIVGQVITALGKLWHVEHFCCATCGCQLGTMTFFERDGKAYCENDYQAQFAPKCSGCRLAITQKCVTAMNSSWHPDCFVCQQCKEPFDDTGFHEKEDKPFCRGCFFDLFAPRCASCHTSIAENYITALEKHWHPACFVCGECRMPFGAASFFEHEGMPYCETHFHARRGSLCGHCQQPITGRCITAMGKKFHPEHFFCAWCLKQLNKGTFKEHNDKPYCHPCHVKLFG